MKNKHNNKSGFTMVELLVVIALLGALVVVSIGPIQSVYKARAKSAASEISAMLSESKIDSLSGKTNEFHLKFDGKNFICTLVDNNGTVLKEESIANKKTNIIVDGVSLNDNSDKELVVTFSNQTGAVTGATLGDDNVLDDKKIVFDIAYISQYQVTVYQITGEVDMQAV